MIEKNKTVNIHVIDPLGADHRKFIQNMGCCGIDRSFHDPNTGTNLIFTHGDELSKNLLHEGAHSFLSQRGPSGILLSLFSNAIHVLFIELQNTELNGDDRNKVSNAINRLLYLRNSFVENMALSHEIFAIGTEIRGMSDIALSQGGGPYSVIERRLDSLISPVMETVKNQGAQIHKKALKVITVFAEVYGFPDIAECIAESIIHYLPSLITNVTPSTLLFGTDEEIMTVNPEVKGIYRAFLKNPPKWANSILNVKYLYGIQYLIGLGKYKAGIMQAVADVMRVCSLHGNVLINHQKFEKWIPEFMSLVPIGPRLRQIFHSLMADTLRFTWAGSEKRKEQLKQFAKFEKIPRKDYEPFNYDLDRLLIKKKYEDLGFVLPEKNETVVMNDPMALPPPAFLIITQGTLNLLLRSDLNCIDFIDFLSYRFIEIQLFEFILGEFKDSKPFICLYYHSSSKGETCCLGHEKCCVNVRLRGLMKSYSQSKAVNPPLVICCQKDFALFISFLPDLDYEPAILMRCPFNIIDIKPEFKGYRVE
jgi:hypothetical protein